MAGTLVAVEIDVHDGTSIQTMRYFSGRDPLGATIAGSRVHWCPGLVVPITFGATISAEQYGATLRGAANGGDVLFDVEEEDYYRLAFGYHFTGHPVRVYAGDIDGGYAGLELQYAGRISDMKFPLDGVIRATISTTDESFNFDNPLVEELYPELETPLAAGAKDPLAGVRGLPKPEVYGTVKLMQPVLLDEANQIYQVSRLPLVAVDAVRVGGIIWTPTTGTPKASQWSADLVAGTIKLGSTTLGQEVRVDARGPAVTTSSLITLLITNAGGVVDTAAMAALQAAAPYQIGWHTSTDPLNLLDALDQIMAGVGGYWLFNEHGVFTAGLLASPTATAQHSLDEIAIKQMSLSGLLPPAWQIQIEYNRNWAPLTSVLPAVTDAERQLFADTGVIAPAYKNEAIKASQPRALDVPVIHSLVGNEADAIAIRDRLSLAWGVPRRIYDVQAFANCPQLYDTVAVDYRGAINTNFRVHSVLRSVGGNPVQMRLWGP